MGVIKKCDCYLTQGTRCTCNDYPEMDKEIKAAEKKEMFLKNKNNPIIYKLQARLKIIENELSNCYDREETLKKKNNELEQRNKYLEVKHNKMRALALGPWEEYKAVQDEMGR